MKIIDDISDSRNSNVLVVGSGLAAYGACLALIEDKSISITVIDIGLDKPYLNQRNMAVPNSVKYDGSFFPYGINDNRSPVILESKRMCSSHAIGGYSKVYSGSILKPKDIDMTGWPIESKPSPKDYKAVLASLRIWQIQDRLSVGFPCYPKPDELNITNSTYMGAPRIALNKVGNQNVPFDASYDFEKWAKDGVITYIPNHFVVQLSQANQKIKVTAMSCNKIKTLWFDKVYLAAGCVNTTAIVDRSINDEGSRKYSIKSAKGQLQLYLQLPLLFSKSISSLSGSIGNPDLCKVFVEHRSNATNGTWSHTQINSFNRTIIEAARQKLPPIICKIILLTKGAFRFSITAFHSDFEKQSILVSSILKTPDTHKLQKLLILEPESEYNRSLVNTIRTAVIKNFFSLGLLPLPFTQLVVDRMKGNRLSTLR